MYQNAIYISIDIAKFADFRWKNADVNRSHVIHIYFGSSLGKV